MSICFYILEFLLAVIVVLLYHRFIDTRHIKRFTKKNLPVDLKLFISSQKIDVKKTKYKDLMRVVSFTNAIDIGLVVLLTNVTDNFLLKFLIAIPSIIGIILISYRVVGLIYKKKGMTLNES